MPRFHKDWILVEKQRREDAQRSVFAGVGQILPKGVSSQIVYSVLSDS